MDQSRNRLADVVKRFSLTLVIFCAAMGVMLAQGHTARASETGGIQIFLPLVFKEYPPTPELTVDDNSINANNGECTTVRWEFIGSDSVEINRGRGFDKSAADEAGTMEVCPSITTDYEATASYPDGTVVTLQVTVFVSGDECNRDPYILTFKPTATQVNRNEFITVTWDVRCNSETYLKLNEDPWHHVPDMLQHEYKMEVSTFFQMQVTKVVDNATVFEEGASFGVTVRPNTRDTDPQE